MNPSLRQTITHLPRAPGVYLFSDRKGQILYVGKARDLRKRVSSYFQRTKQLEPAKQAMVQEVTSLQSIVAPSETEALLLEATLIKRHQPHYNVILKDDKDYLYVRMNLQEPYPAVAFIRRPKSRQGTRLFGPYTSALSIRQTMKLLKKLLPYRTCDEPASRPCFEARLGRCTGHDLGPGSRQRYATVIRGVINFLEGRTDAVLAGARLQMAAAARERKFELAAKLRDQLRSLERVVFRQVIIGKPGESFDVVGLERTNQLIGVALLLVRGGRIIDSRTFLLTARADEHLGAIVTAFLDQYYAVSQDRPKAILLRLPPAEPPFVARQGVRLKLVRRGRGHRLVAMAEENARYFLEWKQREALSDSDRGRRGMEDLMRTLHLPVRPERIETYDISNIQGTNAVGSLVVFEHGLPAKQWYRKFTIKTVTGSDDPRMMAEVLRRRWRNREWPLPQLVVLDGGKGQLSAVKAVFDALRLRVPLIALAKRQEDVYRPGRTNALKLPADSEALLLLARMRDEAHRFAIGFYRGKHRQTTVRSALDTIPGVGPKTKKVLLTTFGSVEGIRRASDKELRKLLPQKLIDALRERL